MKHRAFGPTGRQVAVIGQGTWKLELADPRAAVAAIRRGLDLGMTHIDTAEMYGGGGVERLVAQAIEGRREEVFLTSKVMPRHATFLRVIEACDRSLHNLGTDRLDLYLLHWPGPVPLEQTIAAFEKLARDGKILAWGVSNFDEDLLVRAVEVAGAQSPAGAHGPACNQVYYHLAQRDIEHRALPCCERRGIAVVGYSPFGAGRFPSPRSAGGRVLASIARTHAASPRQVALAFLTRRPGLFAIPRTAREEHAADNAAAADLVLDESELARIDAAFPLGPPRAQLPVIWTDPGS